jgi:uncharacterized Zn-binding protein involved in type VI secretion
MHNFISMRKIVAFIIMLVFILLSQIRTSGCVVGLPCVSTDNTPIARQCDPYSCDGTPTPGVTETPR